MAHITVHVGPVDSRAELEEAARERRLESEAAALRSRAEHAEAVRTGHIREQQARQEQDRLRSEASAAHAQRREALLAAERGEQLAEADGSSAAGPKKG